MNKFEDKILIRYFFYTFLGWFLFLIINMLQFFIFMPIIFLISFIFDTNRVIFPYMTKFFTRLFFFLYFFERINYDKNGIKAPKKGEKRIYVINHASQYDVILMYLLPGPIKFIFKEKWARLPFIGWMAKIAKNLMLGEEMTAGELSNVFRKATKFLEQGIPIIIYPEGTRSTDSKIANFYHGTFKLAVETQADIIPVVFDTWNCIRPGALWIRDVRPTIKILDPIKYSDYEHLNFGRLSHLVRTKMLEGLVDLRDQRRKTEKNYYRHNQKFIDLDNEMKKELIELKEYSKKKSIFLKSDTPLIIENNEIKTEN